MVVMRKARRRGRKVSGWFIEMSVTSSEVCGLSAVLVVCDKNVGLVGG